MGAVKRLQIVGFKNSGKTTLTERLLRLAAGRGLRASAIKHHGHGGPPEPPPAGTDASRFFEAGAASSIVAGGGVIVLQSRQPEADPGAGLDSLIRLTEASAHPDLILIEGFKGAEYDKIALLRSEADAEALSGLRNVRLILAPDDKLKTALDGRFARGAAEDGRRRYPPLLLREENEQIEAWFDEWLKGDANETL
ncbi:molybdopterin-guanine dinucleotide biosynthesis protein B [Saccharibacillus alkalitolerans]|uniref:Molybdopterin-guanine dinucleotide biosynthesis protein B n=1 Tax=Saccharibacillus alkalitolerans TaxID=2705290 RepID=A0ABX0F186_9BACL|nr:molybdopterin-guanine dinucleotide biosynthesis protein B [Saccharibacillus alkalitolerans]NGZ74656.1 molybdopterin-guanine dinucleotide biosynthesis protein B [Saccharibacillus alkalitolerans]